MELTNDQKVAFEKVMDFAKSNGGKQYLTLGGYAGVGKTTLLGHLSRHFKIEGYRLAFCALTGKAANVLRSKVSEYISNEDDFCGTIHKLIYQCLGQDDEKKPIFKRHDDRIRNMKYELIIVDEASMINKRVFDDLLHCGIKILAVGDHGQLSPVEGSFNLMENPEIKLEKIMRQAEGSPIIQVSIMAREMGYIPHGKYGDCVEKVALWDGGEELLKKYFKSEMNQDSIIICGRNKTRLEYNERARGGRHDPVAGDKIICLSNDYDRWVFNGSIGTIKNCSALIKNGYMSKPHYQIEAVVDDLDYSREVLAEQFWNEKTLTDYWEEFGLWSYASAITCHKGQGSQWDNVIVIEEPVGETEDKRRRWIYTATTRASKKLTIIQK